VSNYRAVASNSKKIEQNPYFIQKLVKFTMYFSEIFIFGPFREGASGKIKTTSIINLPTIYQNVIYIQGLSERMAFSR
jgi:hypothetical protein